MKVATDLTEKDLLQIQIQDNGEKLVDITKYCPGILIRKELYESGSKPYLRKTVAGMLNKAKKLLPQNITFIVRDAFRPIEVQKEIWESFEKSFKKEHSNWNKERIEAEVRKFATEPDRGIPPGHSTGGAIDISLAYIKSGRKLKMRASKLSYEEQTQTFNKNLPIQIQKNRKILFAAMTKAGFINYPNEWWHYSFGEAYAVARQNKKLAIYGAIVSCF